jgi:hypothetical protein
MTYFWAYVIGSDGHFQTAHSIKCENDEAAVDASRRSVASDGRWLRLLTLAELPAPKANHGA